MNRLRVIATAVIRGAIALLVTTVLSAAQDGQRPLARTPKAHAATQKHLAQKDLAQKDSAMTPAKPSAKAQMKKSTVADAAEAPARKKEHHLILQVNSNDPAAMNLALNNAMNVTEYYKETGENVKVEVVTFGPGLHMLRDDTSPVKARIETMSLGNPEISFKACGNTQANMHKAENKDIPIIRGVEVVKSGVIRIMELQEQGWTYVKP
jgi:intracellular sulfur oxidation DsrE/DsrF family protein